MKKEAADELARVETHHLALVAVSVVAPSEANMLAIEVDESMIGDGGLVSVAPEVGDYIGCPWHTELLYRRHWRKLYSALKRRRSSDTRTQRVPVHLFERSPIVAQGPRAARRSAWMGKRPMGLDIRATSKTSVSVAVKGRGIRVPGRSLAKRPPSFGAQDWPATSASTTPVRRHMRTGPRFCTPDAVYFDHGSCAIWQPETPRKISLTALSEFSSRVHFWAPASEQLAVDESVIAPARGAGRALVRSGS